MGSYLDRIRARSRRQIAKRTKRRARSGEAQALKPLALDSDQVDAIQTALAGDDIETQPDQAGELAPPVNKPAATVNAPAAVVNEKPLVAAAAQGAAPDIDLAKLAAPPAEATPAPARFEPKSSNIRAAELGADGVLLVEFADGGKYSYANFTPELFEEWQKAKSAGSWFHHNVRTKPDRHPGQKA